jgi:hypothetical protein
LDIDELSKGERYQFDSGLVRRYRLDEISAGWFETIKRSLNPILVEYVEHLLSEHTGTDAEHAVEVAHFTRSDVATGHSAWNSTNSEKQVG